MFTGSGVGNFKDITQARSVPGLSLIHIYRCIHLKVDQFLHTIAQSHKTFYAGFCGGVEIRAL